MKKKNTMPLTITLSVEAYRKIGDLNPNQRPTETVRSVLEALVYYKGNFFDLLGIIATRDK